jgi:hypothetical protein
MSRIQILGLVLALEFVIVLLARPWLTRLDPHGSIRWGPLMFWGALIAIFLVAVRLVP